MNLQKRLERLSIGDSLISPDYTWQVDYVDPSDVDNPGYAVCRGLEVHLLTPNDRPEDRDTVADFLDAKMKETPDKAKPEPGDWQSSPSGSEGNPLWDYGIGQFSLSFPEYFLKLSPHTFSLRTQATVAARRNHTPVKDGETIVGIKVRKCRGSLVTNDIHFQIHKVMALKPHSGGETVGLAQVRQIRYLRLDSIRRDHLEAEGFTTWEQFQFAWEEGKNGQYATSKYAWVITLAPVFTALPPAEYQMARAVPEAVPLAYQWRQLSLPLAMGS